MNNPKLKGYGFNPSDQILIGYLRDLTLFGRDYLVQDIIYLGHDICNYDPRDLPSCDSITPNDSERFFIYPKTYKYKNSKSKVIGMPTEQVPNGDQRQPMINRATKNGKWKVSGVRVNVKSSDDTKQVIGIKTRLYFKPNSWPNKTTCVLHQFELVGIDPCQDKYFLGKVIMKEFKPTNISSNNIDDWISIPEVREELGSEPLVETEVINEYEWTQSEQTNVITPYPVFNKENFIDDENEVISNHQSQVRVELGSESLVETEVINEYEWTQSEQTNVITPYPVFNNENFIDDGNEVISNLQSQVRVEFGSESLVETEAINEYEWTQSEQTNVITPYPVFDNENFIDDGNEVISNHQSQINMELIRTLEIPNIGIEDQNQSYQNIGIDYDRTVPDEGSNQHNIVAVAENESSILPANLQDHLIDFINQMEWSDLYNLCRRKDDGLFLDELSDEPQELGPQNQCGINEQVAAGADIVCTNLPPLDVAESSYSTDSVRKRSAMEVEGSGTGVETEFAQQQAKRSRS
ncbi:hypothetical protein CXB51_006505 [Gossypium anomalum]|uniref:NAC domain-containing protein n=1 Tax=Gossypium anomalum TaxID=47600 RepID=A0A8J5ZDU8_9ROSI|nr:hypothetical protein CXB51_006505 [Gossypium anomalum]